MPSRLSKFCSTLNDDRGGAAVEFILTFPIFLWIVAIVVQMALLVNAKVMVDYAAQVAARSAVTSLPEGKPDNVRTAASMALAPLSPEATGDPAAEGQTLSDALASTGITMPPTFPARYTFAAQATTVNWDPQMDFTTTRGQSLTVSLIYHFQLTVPGAKMLIGASDTVGGVSGRFLDIGSDKVQVQTSHSRKAASDGNGWPD